MVSGEVGCVLAVALVHDLREHRVAANEEELAGFGTGVLARAPAELADSTICTGTGRLELIGWFGRPLREMQSADAGAGFG